MGVVKGKRSHPLCTTALLLDSTVTHGPPAVHSSRRRRGSNGSKGRLDVLDGFVTADGEALGRPVGVAVDRSGALLVADGVGNII